MDESQASRKISVSSDEDERIANLFIKERSSMQWFRCIRILIWKFFLMRLRTPFMLLLEALVPGLLTYFVIHLENNTKSPVQSQCHVPSLNLPSMGMLSYLRTLVCNANHQCTFDNQDFDLPFEGVEKIYNELFNISKDIVPLMRVTNYSTLEPSRLPGLFKRIDAIYKEFYYVKPPVFNDDMGHKLDALNYSGIVTFFCGRNGKLIEGSSVASIVNETFKKYSIRDHEFEETMFCDALISLLRNKNYTHVTSRFRQFAFGRIFYFPSTKLANSIMSLVSEKFSIFAKMERLANEWNSTLMNYVSKFITNSTEGQDLQRLFKQCKDLQVCSFIQTIFTPNTSKNLTRILTTAFYFMKNCFHFENKVRGYANKTDFENDLMHKRGAFDTPAIGVEFEDLPEVKPGVCSFIDHKVIPITYRLAADLIPETQGEIVKDSYWDPRTPVHPHETRYISSGVVDVQDMVEEAYMYVYTSKNHPLDENYDPFTSHVLPATLKFMSSPCYRSNLLTEETQPYIVSGMSVVPICVAVHYVVMLKCKALQEFTKLYGFSESMYFLALFFMIFITTAPMNVLTALILAIYGVIKYEEMYLLIFIILSYTIALISWSFFVATFFTNTRKAVLLALTFNIGFISFGVFVKFWASMPSGMIDLFCLLPQVSYFLINVYLMRGKIQNITLSWNSLKYQTYAVQPHSIVNAVTMLWVDILIYNTLTWYLNAVIPDKNKVRRPLYFMFTKNYWFSAQPSGKLEQVMSSDAISTDSDMKISEKMPICLELAHIQMTFPGDRRPVIKNLSAKFIKGKIAAIIGPQGAGKATLLSIIAGIKKPDLGYVFVNGYDIGQKKIKPGAFISYCPKDSFLIPFLTVTEQVKFFGKLRGLSHNQIVKSIAKVETLCSFEKIMKKPVNALTFEQNKLLSVVLTFLGKVPIVLMDSPTEKMGDSDRNIIWKTILTMKRSKTVILATSNLEEAETIADFVYILRKGHLKRHGPSIYLRKILGSDYHMYFVKASSFPRDNSRALDCLKILTDRIRNTKVDGLEVMGQSVNSINFSISNRFVTSDEGSKFLHNLENMKELYKWPYHMKRFKITDATVDGFALYHRFEMISKSRRMVKRRKIMERKYRSLRPNSVDVTTYIRNKMEAAKLNEITMYEKLVDSDLSHSQINALVWKKICQFKRSWKTYLYVLLYPLIVLTCGLSLLGEGQKLATHHRLQVNPWLMVKQMQNPTLHTFMGHNLQLEQMDIDARIADLILKKYQHFIDVAIKQDYFATFKCFPILLHEPLQPTHLDYCFSNEFTWQHESPNATKEVNASQLCTCGAGTYMRCPVRPPLPPQIRTQSGFMIFNLASYDIPDYVLKTTYDFISVRFGGMELVVSKHLPELVKLQRNLNSSTELLKSLFGNNTLSEYFTKVLSLLGKISPPLLYMRLYVNPRGFISSTAYLNILHNMQIRMANKEEKERRYGIRMNILPYDRDTINITARSTERQAVAYWSSATMFIAFTLIPLPFAVYIIDENATGSKDFQFRSGLPCTIYWFFTFMCDCIYYWLCALTCILFIYSNNISFYVRSDRLVVFLGFVLAYGPAIIAEMYLLSFVSRYIRLSYTGVFIMNLALGVLPNAYTAVVDYLRSTVHLQVETYYWAFFIPQWCFMRGLFSLYFSRDGMLLKAAKEPRFYHCLNWNLVIALAIHPVLYMGIVFGIEGLYRFSLLIHNTQYESELTFGEGKATGEEAEHNPVAIEIETVENMYEDRQVKFDDTLMVVNLTRRRWKGCKYPLHGVTFYVSPGDCFGLVSDEPVTRSAFVSILTGRLLKSKGRVVISNVDLTEHLKAINRHIAYSPSGRNGNGLVDYMTVEECLHYFASLVGVPNAKIMGMVANLVELMEMREVGNAYLKHCTAGDLRLISFATCIMRQTQVLLLEEPMLHMDIYERHILTRLVQLLRQDGKIVLVVTNDFEVSKQVCNRTGVIHEGRMKLIGESNHLDEKYNEGYRVVVQSVSEVHDPDIIIQYFEGNIEFVSFFGKLYKFRVAKTVPVSYIFHYFHAMVKNGLILNFSVHPEKYSLLPSNIGHRRDSS